MSGASAKVQLLPLVVVIFLAAALTGVGAAWMSAGGSPPDPKSDSTRSADAAPKPRQIRLDRWGDPLPANAIARLGTFRFFHGETVDRVAISQDGLWIVSTGSDGNRLWEASTGRELPLTANVKQAPVFTISGRLVAAERGKDRLRLWDVATGKKVQELREDLSNSLFGLSPDGRTLVWWALNQARQVPVLRFCDVVTGRIDDPIELPANEQVLHFAFTADSKILVTGHQTQSLHVWDVASRKEILSTPAEGPPNSGMKIALAPTGSVLAVAPSGKSIRLLDVRTLKELPPLLSQNQQHVNALTFSADGKRLAVNYSSTTVHVWDMETRRLARRFEGKGPQVFGTVFSADGKFLVGADGPSVTLWDLATGQFRPPCDYGHAYTVRAISFSPDGTSLVCGASYRDSRIHVWDPRSGNEKGSWTGHAGGIEAIAHSPDGRLVASGSQDRTIRLWDRNTGKELRRLEPFEGIAWALAFSPDSKTLASGGGASVHLWDLESGRELRSFDKPGNQIARLAFSPDGKTLTTKGIDEPFLRLWSVADGKLLRQFPGSKMGTPFLPLSPDGRLLAMSEADGTIRLQDLDSGTELPPLSLQLPKDSPNAVQVSDIAFSPDGRNLAVGYADGMVRLWELASSHERVCFHGHRGSVARVTFSPDGTLLASGGWDRVVMVWDVAGTTTARRPFPARLTPDELNTLWNELATLDAAAAFRAVQRLSGAGQTGVNFLKDRLHPVAGVDGKRINQLIAALDSDKIRVRNQASLELEKLGDIAEPDLRKALAGNPSAEVRQRLERIQEKMVTVGAPERLRGVRAVEVLEKIGSVDACGVLEILSKGMPEARLTQEALAAIARQRK